MATSEAPSLILKHMYETGEWSDLSIETGAKSFKVHQIVVCPSCTFFQAACTNGSKESKTGIIHLEETETVVDALLRHLYDLPIDWLHYTASHRLYLERISRVRHVPLYAGRDSKDDAFSSMNQEELLGRVHDIMRLEVAGDKYSLPSLENEARLAFITYYKALSEPRYIVEIGDIVYKQNGIFKEAVAASCGKNIRAIMADSCAWSELCANAEYLKAVMAWTRRFSKMPRRKSQLIRYGIGAECL